MTATLVALVRAISSTGRPDVATVRDPYARAMLPRGFGLIADVLGRPSVFALARPLLAPPTLGFLDHVALRTLAIDLALCDGLRGGVEQVVILGAGLDARVFRMEELRGVFAYEVDHPATQQYKLPRSHGWRSAAREVRHVAVDFERDDLAAALLAAGHESARRTFWIWEGVTVHLAPAAVDATLRAIAERSCVGSLVAITYVTPEMLPGGALLHRAVRAAAGTISEPIRGLVTRAQMTSRVEARGFEPRSDENTREWAERFWPIADRAGVVSRERLLVAERTARPVVK